MYNPLLNLDRDYNKGKRDVLAGLRSEIELWLTKPNHTQDVLAKRSGISPQMLCDVLANRRGCSPDTYEKIVTALRANGNRITGLQENGRKVGKSMELNEANMTATYARHDKQLSEMVKATAENNNIGTFQVNRSEKTL